MTRGACSFSVNPTTRTVVGKDWTAYHAALGITDVRVPVTTALDGSLPTALYRQAADTYAQAGIRCLVQLTRAFQPVGGEIATQGLFPNSGLYRAPGMDPLSSEYIDGWTLRAEGFARQLVPHGWTSWLVWNEPNAELVPVGTDANASGPKPGAMAPSVYAGLAWQATHRLKAVGVMEVWLGPLSVLPHLTGLDPKNPYYAAWVDLFYQTLEQHGHHGPWPWTGWALNSEGWWDDAGFAPAGAVLRGVMARHGDGGKLIVTEMGITNTAVETANAPALTLATCKAITAHTDGPAHWFQAPGDHPYLADPALFATYGMFSYREANGLFIPGPAYRLQPFVQAAWTAAGM